MAAAEADDGVGVEHKLHAPPGRPGGPIPALSHRIHVRLRHQILPVVAPQPHRLRVSQDLHRAEHQSTTARGWKNCEHFALIAAAMALTKGEKLRAGCFSAGTLSLNFRASPISGQWVVRRGGHSKVYATYC